MNRLSSNTSKVIEALDVLGYPALITDEGGDTLAANVQARYLMDQGLHLDKPDLASAGDRVFAVGGMQFQCLSRPIGQGTSLLLHELRRTDDACRSLRESTQRLAERLEARTF